MTLSVEAQGTVFIARDNRRLTQLRRGATKRSTIKVFSGASRRRLIELACRLDCTRVRTSFLTLTFHACPSPAEAKRAFKAFTMRIRRKFPKAAAIWRMEFQKRGAVHFHLIMYHLPYWAQWAIQKAWQECTHEDMSIVHIKLLEGGNRQVIFYVSKYVAKRSEVVASTSLDNAPYQHGQEETGEDDPGRFWGYLNRDGLPWGVRRLAIVDHPEMIAPLWREMQRLSAGRAATQARAARLYGTCCYDLAEKVVHNASVILYDETRVNSSKKLYACR